MATPSITPTPSPVTIVFDRRLSGDGVGQHKAPPLGHVTVTVEATVDTSATEATLSDYFPTAWGVADSAGGVVSAVDATTSRIDWKVGDIPAGGMVSMSYTLISPPLTTPPTEYEFQSELSYVDNTVLGDPWRVTVSDAPPAQSLHAAQATVGSTTYNTVNTLAVSGPQATSSASYSATGTYTLSDSGGHSIFVSDPVPSGQSRDLSGSWSFNIRARSTSGTGSNGVLQGLIYRISATGAATLVATTGNSPNVIDTNTLTTRSWSYTVSGFTLNAGERFGVAFQVVVSTRGSSTGAEIAYDTTSNNSTVTPPITARLQEAHYRIGQDTSLGSMQWYAATDTAATGLQRGINFRVRFQVYNDTGTSQTWTPRLEWATSSTGPWTTVPIASDTNPFFVAQTAQFTNGAAIAANGLGAGTGTWTNGVAYDTQNPGANLTLNGSNYTEIEFNLQANANAAYNRPYYFRITDGGSDLGSYANHAQVSLSAPVVKEAHYRIGKDTTLATMQWYASTDTAVSAVVRGDLFRLRFQLYNDGINSSNWSPQLEWSTSTTGSWAPVTPGSPFVVAATTQFADGAAIPTANFGLGTGSGSAQQGAAYDAQNPAASFTLNAASYTEIEFSVRSTSDATPSTPYYFRLSDAGAPLTQYANYAQLSLARESPAHGDMGGYDATTDACAKCHRTHDASIAMLTSAKPSAGISQEAVCYTCHDGTGASKDIKTQFTRSYKHEIDANDVHRFGENSSAQFSGANRHVECTDCHEPHAAFGGNHAQGSSSAGNVLVGASGVSITNDAAWTAPTYSFTGSVTQEYQLCLKCHSSWAYGSSPPTSHTGGIVETDQAVEFNVNNASYHWVEGDRTASSGVTPRTDDGRNMDFVTGSGWTKISKMSCSDCHASDADTDPSGPHGSTQSYLLRGNWATNTGKTGTSADLCFKCHDWDTYGPSGGGTGTTTGFSNGTNNLHRRHMGYSGVTGCQACHSAVPHGSQYRALLAPRVISGIDQPVTAYNANSKLNVAVWANSGNWSKSSCGSYTGCH